MVYFLISVGCQLQKIYNKYGLLILFQQSAIIAPHLVAAIQYSSDENCVADGNNDGLIFCLLVTNFI
jgi:hypothetical protein